MASSKITALPAYTSVPALTDVLPFVHDPGGTPVNDKITVGTLLYLTQTLTDQATIAWDMSLGGFATVTLAGSRTLAAPSNLQAGRRYWLLVVQGGSGSYTITWNAVFKWAGASAPTLSTTVGYKDLIEFTSDGTSLYGRLFGANMS